MTAVVLKPQSDLSALYDAVVHDGRTRHTLIDAHANASHVISTIFSYLSCVDLPFSSLSHHIRRVVDETKNLRIQQAISHFTRSLINQENLSAQILSNIEHDTVRSILVRKKNGAVSLELTQKRLLTHPLLHRALFFAALPKTSGSIFLQPPLSDQTSDALDTVFLQDYRSFLQKGMMEMSCKKQITINMIFAASVTAGSPLLTTLSLKMKADVNFCPADALIPPLHMAAGRSNVAVLSLLIKHRVDVHDFHPEGERGRGGFRAIQYAAMFGRTESVRLLLQAGSCFQYGGYNLEPIALCMKYEQWETAQFLIAQKASIEPLKRLHLQTFNQPLPSDVSRGALVPYWQRSQLTKPPLSPSKGEEKKTPTKCQ